MSQCALATAPKPCIASAYDPATDPDWFADVVNTLRRREGEWCHPGRLVLKMRGGECDCAVLAKATGRVVEAARHLGDEILGDPVLGYCYTGYARRLYVRLSQLEFFDVFEAV